MTITDARPSNPRRRTIGIAADAYASPERQLVFDVNDFDETATVRHGPVRRAREPRRLVCAAPVDQLAQPADTKKEKKEEKEAREIVGKARSRDSLQALGKLPESDGETYRIKSEPPVLLPLRELSGRGGSRCTARRCPRELPLVRGEPAGRSQVPTVHLPVRRCRSESRRRRQRRDPVRHRPARGRDREDPLFLQVKEASVRCSRNTFLAASTRTTGVAWSRDST